MGIISLGIFYLWPTYLDGNLKPVYHLFLILIFLLIIYDIFKKKHKLNFYCKYLVIFILLIISNVLFYRNYITESKFVLIIFFLPYFIAYYTFLPHKDKLHIFYFFNKLFIIIIVPSITIWLLLAINWNLPYTIILPAQEGKLVSGMIYKCYFHLSILLMHFSETTHITRLCGIFDEPGVVGTVCGLLLAANGFSFTKRENIIIFTAGILSFSTAFYIILMLLIFFKILKNTKASIIFLIPFLVLSYVIFVNLPITFAPLKRVQNAIVIENGGIRGNNRESEEAKSELNRIFKNNKFELLWVFGYESIKNTPQIYGSWSYRLFIYERGLCAVFIYSLQLFIAIWYANKNLRFNYDQRVLIFIFMLSLYQRPDALCSIAYSIILVGGIANCKDKMCNTLYRKEL